MEHDQNDTVLPSSIVSPTDVARLNREIEAVDNFFRDAQIRQAGTPNVMPRLSKLMDQLVSNNKLNLLQEADRAKIVSTLGSLYESAPVMHISFSVDPPGPYVQKIVSWLRRNIHPQVLVTVGLQPNIGAGCVVRTTNKLFDLSLREYFSQKRDFFIKKLHDSISDPGKAEVATGEGIVAAPPTKIDVATSPTPEVMSEPEAKPEDSQ